MLEENSMKTKSLKDILKEGLFDVISFDKGLFRTQIDVIRHPDKVIAAYHNNDLTYTRPIAFCIFASTIYLLVINYVIDWEAFSNAFVSFVLDLSNLFSHEPIGPSEELEEIVNLQKQIFEFVLKKFFVVLLIAQAFIRAAGFARITDGANFTNMLVVMLYRNAGGILIQSLTLLLFLFMPNKFGFVGWLMASFLADQLAFRNYINVTLGQGSRKLFQKRFIVIISIIVALAIITGLIWEWIENNF